MDGKRTVYKIMIMEYGRHNIVGWYCVGFRVGFGSLMRLCPMSTNQPTRVAQQLALPTYEEILIFRMHWHKGKLHTTPRRLQWEFCLLVPSCFNSDIHVHRSAASITFRQIKRSKPSCLFSNSDLDDIFSSLHYKIVMCF